MGYTKLEIFDKCSVPLNMNLTEVLNTVYQKQKLNFPHFPNVAWNN